MIKNKNFLKKISAATAAIIMVSLLSGCDANVLVAPPTLVVPTSNVTEQPTGNNGLKPTPTPDAEEEIYFSDINLENIIRDIIGKNIGPITRADVENITELSARVRGITNIDALKYFTNLEKLDLYGNRISDLSALANITSLKRLNLGKNYNVLTAGTSSPNGLDITPLKSLVLLEELDLSDNMLTDLSGIGSLTMLKTLILSKNRIADISPLSTLKSLTYVDLSYNYGLNSDNTERGISDLSPLYGITTLETLIAGYNLITDLQGIENMTALKYIDLTDNFVTSVEFLAKVPNLKTVILHCNALTSLNEFKNNKTIKVLDVSLNMITNFDVILTMSMLEDIKWEQNNIQDYTAIDEFEARKNGQR